MLVVLRQGGLGSGGFNFDAKCRRGSGDSLDLFYGHIAGIDAFARGLLVADRILQDGVLDRMLATRYESYAQGIGAEIVAGRADFESLEQWVLAHGEPVPKSGRQEMLELILNNYLTR